MEGEVGLKTLPLLFLVLGVAAVIGGAMAVSLSQFGDSITNQCLNTSFSYDGANSCLNNTLFNYTTVTAGVSTNSLTQNNNMSPEFYVVWQGLQSQETIGGQLGTVGIIGVMVLIIGLLVGVFAYLRYFY